MRRSRGTLAGFSGIWNIYMYCDCLISIPQVWWRKLVYTGCLNSQQWDRALSVERILRECILVMWIVWVWPKIGSSGGPSWWECWAFGFKMTKLKVASLVACGLHPDFLSQLNLVNASVSYPLFNLIGQESNHVVLAPCPWISIWVSHTVKSKCSLQQRQKSVTKITLNRFRPQLNGVIRSVMCKYKYFLDRFSSSTKIKPSCLGMW
jgi:hypothetical protein